MPPARTQHRSATTPPSGRPHRKAQHGRRFTRSAPPPTRGGLPRRRRQPEPGRAEQLWGFIRGALPGGEPRSKGKGSAVPVVGRFLGGKKRASGGRGRKPALLGLLGAGAAGAAVAAKRRRGEGSKRPSETQPVSEPQTATTSVTKTHRVG